MEIGRAESFRHLQLAQPTKATLRREVSTQAGMIRNQWDYWLFPEARRDSAALSRLFPRSIEPAEAAGGRGEFLCCFGSKPFPSPGMSFQMGLAGRPKAHLATVVARHP